MEQRPRLRTDLAVAGLDAEAVVYDPRSGALHRVNPSAAMVLAMCDGATTPSEMSDALSARFEVPGRPTIEHVEQALGLLLELGMLEAEVAR